ncbi:PIG-L family deacetylase [Cellulosimicrobium cellulans]|uniref:PIG-L deacetylase family protein n=1 Tax=Cellulosimicrobium cellulans TaxID=1710 RepID=UPI001EDB8812|nr:PIG-L deacetylase family protein [Cellulosimicrobium cellulans]UKJ63669.1 PIG-L family deacetylase [Cellulosimicrobium cellulans]
MHLLVARWFARHVLHSVAFARSAIAVLGALIVANVACLVMAPEPLVSTDVLLASSCAALLLGGTAFLLRRPVTRTARPRRIVAVGAHPDDLELACGATLAKLVDSGHEVHAMVLSKGDAGATVSGDRRAAEATRGAAFFGASTTVVHDFPDTLLDHAMPDLVDVIEKLVREVDPDVVLTHSANDQHQDHHAVHVATLRAARQVSTILCFESPSVTRSFDPSFFVDVSDHFDVKVHAVGMHRDQVGKPYMTAERLRGVATFRGAQVRGGLAEAFETVRVLGSAIGDL